MRNKKRLVKCWRCGKLFRTQHITTICYKCWVELLKDPNWPEKKGGRN
jgi:Zn finger protein HypA/HybF involved in hydrogenase expression